jgi:minor extracellular serine protease Vpr
LGDVSVRSSKVFSKAGLKLLVFFELRDSFITLPFSMLKMKKSSLYQIVVFLSTLFFLTGYAYSQPRIASESRYIIKTVELEYKTSLGKSEKWDWMLKQYPLYKTHSGYSLAFLAKKNPDFNPTTLTDHGMEIGSIIGNIFTVRVPVTSLSLVTQLSGVEYLEVAGKVSPELNHVLFDTRVDSVHQGINLPDIYNGQDVLIGVTDWGFDYSHPMFYDTLLTQTRIHAAWDQYKTSGPAPSGYSFGAEFNGAVELLAAQTDTTNFYGHNLHGTHVAGIAGGSGAGTIYRGIAYQSEFLFVTLQIDQAAILDAFNWMKAKADAAGKRLVVNMSWGLYYTGTLDGNSLTSQAIDVLSSQGVVFCNSAGNNGNATFHIKHDFNTDTLKSRLAFYTYTDTLMWGQSVNMWGEVGNSFQARYRFLNVSNQIMGETPVFNTAVDTNYIDTMYVLGTDTMEYRMGADNAHPLNGRPHMRFRIKPSGPYKVVLVAYADSGLVHFWNVTELVWGEGNWGQSFESLGAGYTAGDTQYGISEPAVTNSLITVAAHTAEYKNAIGNIVNGYVCTFSSFGPTIDGRMKPDVSAPGGNVCSSINSYTTQSYTAVTTVTFNSRVYPFAKLSGTSMSSPATAGVAALILDANPLLTAQEVKDIIMLTAREDAITGDIPDSGSTRWGQGKVNAYLAVAMALNVVNINTYAQQGLVVFPNPTYDQLYVFADKDPDKVYNLNIYSMDGKLMQSSLYQWNTPIEVCTLPNGMYVIRISADTESYQCKFIKS